jgi:hypothetical protein
VFASACIFESGYEVPVFSLSLLSLLLPPLCSPLSSFLWATAARRVATLKEFVVVVYHTYIYIFFV